MPNRGNILMFTMDGELMSTQIGIIKHLIWDGLQINGYDVMVLNQDKPIHILQSIFIPLMDKLRVKVKCNLIPIIDEHKI